jgi:predicted methyltransferase
VVSGEEAKYRVRGPVFNFPVRASAYTGGMSAIPPVGGRRAVPALPPVYFSHYQAAPLLRARRQGEGQARTSIDLNLTMVIVQLAGDGVALPDGRCVPWEMIEEASSNESGCFLLEDGRMDKVQRYSEVTGRVYTLYPTPGAPTMLVSGVPMHRIKGTDPFQDTMAKIRTITPAAGYVLDTATGLGYTACQASRGASRVITIELDPAAQEVARLNPWSQELFDSPKIEKLLGDSYDIVPAFAAETFDCIIHDPPQFSLAGELYSGELYAALYRVLRPGGKLFHYVGDPASKSGAGITRGVVKRLGEAGFRKVTARPEAFGVSGGK